ncbi:MAG: TonB-dependent receptor domain-containing protein [Gemmatimonadales bacterium]
MRRSAFASMLLAAALPLAPLAGAQEGPAIAGVIVDSTTGAPVPGGAVRVIDPATQLVLAQASSNGRGRFRLAVPPQPAYVLAVSAIGYAPRQLEVAPSAAPLTVTLERVQYLAEQVVTPARASTTVAQAEASVSVLTRAELERRVIPDGPTGQLRDVAGMYVARKGLLQHSFGARGPGAVNSGALLVLTDYRLASLPALRLNVPYLVPPSTDDVARIEVVRGPGSALYGPDADRGVVHLITRSPLDGAETVASLSAGERSLVQGGVRHASRIGSRLGLKVSGEYVRADDWPALDPNELVARDPRVERASAEARIDWRADDRTTVAVTGGLADAIRLVDLTEVGAVQLRNWRSGFVQARVERGALFVNAFANLNAAGESFQLRTGAPVVDDSRTLSVQVQHGASVSGDIGLRYGAEVQRITPQTGGTVHGRNEADDEITQLGGYVHATATPTPWLDLIAAVRLDHHSRLDDAALSPRLGVLLRAGEAHNFRATFNRATSTPVATDLFLDLVSGRVPLGLPDPSLDYTIRAVGTAEAYTFRRDCGGALGLCMRSPFTPTPGQYLPADATLLWPALQAAAQGGLDGIPAPTAADVPTRLGALDLAAGTFVPIEAGAITDVPAGRRVFTTTLELGYVGRPAPGVTVAVDVHRTHTSSLGNALSVQTPNVFIDGAALAEYLVGNGLPADAAAQLASGLAQLPVGTISPIEARDPTDILIAPRQGRPGSYWGGDLTLDVELSRIASLRGTYSWVSRDLFRGAAGPADVALNAPRHRGAIALTLEWPRPGLGAELRGRSQNGFPVISGVYQGEVPAFTELDATVTWRLPWARNVTLSVSGLNLFDRVHREFVGAPLIGRLLLTRVRAAL